MSRNLWSEIRNGRFTAASRGLASETDLVGVRNGTDNTTLSVVGGAAVAGRGFHPRRRSVMRSPLLLLALFALGLATAPASALELTNPRNTYGELGGTRPEAALLPGDVLFVGFDIEGLLNKY